MKAPTAAPLTSASAIRASPTDSVERDLHLFHSSPCRDAGTGSVPNLPDDDFEGDPRMAGSAVDMGADEFHTHLYLTGETIPGGAVEGKIVGLPGTDPVGLFLGSGVLPDPVNTMWGAFHLQAPWFLFALNPLPADGVLILPATLPASVPAPYELPMQALVGLNPDSFTNLYLIEVK